MALKTSFAKHSPTMLLALFRGASLSADRSHIAVGVTWAVTRHGIEAMLVLAVLEFGLELGLLSFRSPLPFALLNSSGSFATLAAIRRASLSPTKRNFVLWITSGIDL